MRRAWLVIPPFVLLGVITPLVVQAQFCGTPGADGAGGVLSGVVNTYYPGTASAAAGATSLVLGPRRGATTSITTGNLLLVIQMQDAEINSTNTTSYGDGVAGGPASGATALNSTGLYEFVRATSSISASGGVLTFAAAGPGGGLLNAYNNANASSTRGARRFQVVRVPQYTTASLSSALIAEAWDGRTGGVLALDVRDVLDLNNAVVSVSGLGFRGGAGVALAGGAGSSSDIRSASSSAYHGGKGEGIAGFPRYMWNGVAVVDSGAVFTIPGGDRARGAPGNAGGGGTDGAPLSNTENSGGGGGGNGGSGGQGGNSWTSQLAVGGFGGAALPAPSAQRFVMGGGGGAGSRNGAGPSHGGSGGGILFVRAHALTGDATLSATGTTADTDSADGGGGGGAGGTVIVAVRSASLTGLKVSVRGGNGGDANAAVANAGPVPGNRYGPGGGGGGGVAILTGAPSASIVQGGVAGTTCGNGGTFGATDGATGVLLTIADESVLTGMSSGALCYNAPPVLLGPASQSLGADTVLTFGASSGNAITLTDDAGVLEVELRVLATGGIVTLGSTSGLVVTGDGTASIVATGPLAALATALDGLSFHRPGASAGPGSLTLMANDLGHDGPPGPARNDTLVVALAWGALDAPSANGGLQLSPVHPNPSRATPRLAFVLPREGRARLDVFDSAGRRVAGVAERNYPAGRTTLSLLSEREPSLAPGVYRAVLRTEWGTRSRSFVLIR